MSNNTTALLPRPIYPDWNLLFLDGVSGMYDINFSIYIHDTNTDKVLVTVTENGDVIYQEYHLSKNDIILDKKYLIYHEGTTVSLCERPSVTIAKCKNNGYEVTNDLQYVSGWDFKYYTPYDYQLLPVCSSFNVNNIRYELMSTTTPYGYNVIRQYYTTEEIKEAFTKLPFNFKPEVAKIIRQAKELRVATV